jgi:hypothetical protein
MFSLETFGLVDIAAGVAVVLNIAGYSMRRMINGEMLVISYDEVRQLQVQNPGFAIYFLQIATSRMFQNMKAMEAELAQLRAAKLQNA